MLSKFKVYKCWLDTFIYGRMITPRACLLSHTTAWWYETEGTWKYFGGWKIHLLPRLWAWLCQCTRMSEHVCQEILHFTYRGLLSVDYTSVTSHYEPVVVGRWSERLGRQQLFFLTRTYKVVVHFETKGLWDFLSTTAVNAFGLRFRWLNFWLFSAKNMLTDKIGNTSGGRCQGDCASVFSHVKMLGCWDDWGPPAISLWVTLCTPAFFSDPVFKPAALCPCWTLRHWAWLMASQSTTSIFPLVHLLVKPRACDSALAIEIEVELMRAANTVTSWRKASLNLPVELSVIFFGPCCCLFFFFFLALQFIDPGSMFSK